MSTSRDSLARAIFIIDNRLASNPARVWGDGAIYGHNTEGRLIDKRDENPYPTIEGAS